MLKKRKIKKSKRVKAAEQSMAALTEAEEKLKMLELGEKNTGVDINKASELLRLLSMRAAIDMGRVNVAIKTKVFRSAVKSVKKEKLPSNDLLVKREDARYDLAVEKEQLAFVLFDEARNKLKKLHAQINYVEYMISEAIHHAKQCASSEAAEAAFIKAEEKYLLEKQLVTAAAEADLAKLALDAAKAHTEWACHRLQFEMNRCDEAEEISYARDVASLYISKRLNSSLEIKSVSSLGYFSAGAYIDSGTASSDGEDLGTDEWISELTVPPAYIS